MLLYDITRGVDVGTKHDIYELMVELLGEGKALLFYSSETEEMAHLCHRVLVMREGRVAVELAGDETDAEGLVAAAMGRACVRVATPPRRIGAGAAGALRRSSRRRCCSRCSILAGTLGVYIGLFGPTSIVSPATSSGRR